MFVRFFRCFLPLFIIASCLPVGAQILGAGRAGPSHFQFELYGGVGGMDSVKGSLSESKDAVILPGGLNLDLEMLGIEEDINSWFAGVRTYNNWVQFLFDYRTSSLKASGRAQEEFRINVGKLGFGDGNFEYLIIPVDAEYDINADATWMGLGIRVTPFTINPEGRLRLTPWAHFGVQVIDASYDIDAGATTDLRFEGFPQRTYAVRGQASGSERAGIPEYGFGGELRFLFDPKRDFGPEIVAQATWKMLDFQGAIDSIGIDKKEFKDINFDYQALEFNLFMYLPLSASVDLIAGIYVEQVDVTATLQAKDLFGSFDRDVEFSYTLYGFRAGLRF